MEGATKFTRTRKRRVAHNVHDGVGDAEALVQCDCAVGRREENLHDEQNVIHCVPTKAETRRLDKLIDDDSQLT